MSLARQRFLEGFVQKCAAFGITEEDVVLGLLKESTDSALDAVKEVYKKTGKAPQGYGDNELMGSTGTYAYSTDAEGPDKSTRYHSRQG